MNKVSIIVPLHNAAQYIGETLNACFLQSHTDIELIVVENGSTDSGYDVVNHFTDSRLSIFRIPSGSAAIARNYGYRKSSGAYVMFLDADDIISPDKIASQVAALQASGSNYVASCAWAKFWNEPADAHIVPQQVWRVQKPVEWCLHAWRGHGMMQTGCWLIPREVIEKAGLWDSRFTLHDDGEFMCRVLLASDGNLFIDNALLYYRQSEEIGRASCRERV